MIFDPSTAPHLKPWLIRTLEPICDAEPGALSDYILALLKHNVPESDMRKELVVQLDEFLEKECTNFIDTLFTVLRTKSYLPYTAASPSASYNPQKSLDTGIPIPFDGLLAPPIHTSPNRKRNLENDERDGRPPAKGPRLSTEGQFSRYNSDRGHNQDTRSTGGWGSRPPVNTGQDVVMSNPIPGMSGAMPGSMNGRTSQYLPPDQRRGICRDYHNSGYCARGAFCKFSHGDDAVVPNQLYQSMPAPPMPFMPMFQNGGIPFGIPGPMSGAYDPHEARMDMRPHSVGRSQNRAPIIQREEMNGMMHPIRTSGELPVIQDLTPKTDESTPQSKSEPDPSSSLPDQGIHQIPVVQYTPPSRDFSAPPPQLMSGPSNSSRNGDPGPYYPRHNNGMNLDPPAHRPQSNGFRGGRKGTFGGEVHNFRPERRNDKTLVVEKIPDDKLTLEHVNGWFKRFGTVTNVAIDSANAKALVSFSNHEDAHSAWKSEDAVFNNRFVKLFWHRPLEGHGQVGTRMLAASAPLVANITSTPPAPTPTSIPTANVPTPAATSTKQLRKPSVPSPAATALAAKQKVLEQQISEQKTLMASLDTASADEKKVIMARLRKLGDEMKATPMTSTAASPAKPAVATASTAKKPTGPGDHERKERERLDKELELHNAISEEDGPEDLKAKLERLKAEAASLGLADSIAETSFASTSYRPYRGRGRGAGARSFYRGAARGGPPPRASMKLDNRPKKLLVKGVPQASLQALKDWYETTGHLDSADVSENGDVVVTFKTRSAAEQGLTKGTNIPAVGAVQISWFTGQRPATKASTSSTAEPTTSDADGNKMSTSRAPTPDPESVRADSPPVVEEEEISTGWGGDGEDGMGMF